MLSYTATAQSIFHGPHQHQHYDLFKLSLTHNKTRAKKHLKKNKIIYKSKKKKKKKSIGV